MTQSTKILYPLTFNSCSNFPSKHLAVISCYGGLMYIHCYYLFFFHSKKKNSYTQYIIVVISMHVVLCASSLIQVNKILNLKFISILVCLYICNHIMVYVRQVLYKVSSFQVDPTFSMHMAATGNSDCMAKFFLIFSETTGPNELQLCSNVELKVLLKFSLFNTNLIWSVVLSAYSGFLHH